jgi:hypothetical protein
MEGRRDKGETGVKEEKAAPVAKKEATPEIFILESPPVDPEVLRNYLSEGDDRWSVGETDGHVEVFGGGSISKVSRTYQNSEDKRTMRVELIDTNRSSVLATPFKIGSIMSETFPDGFREFSKTGEWPTIREFRKGEEYARISTLLADRYIVEISGSGVDHISQVDEFWMRIRGRLGPIVFLQDR